MNKILILVVFLCDVAYGLDSCFFVDALSCKLSRKGLNHSNISYPFHLLPNDMQNIWNGFRNNINRSKRLSQSFKGSHFHDNFSAFKQEIESERLSRLPCGVNIKGKHSAFLGRSVRNSSMLLGSLSGVIYSFPQTGGMCFLLPAIGCNNSIVYAEITYLNSNNCLRDIFRQSKLGNFIPINSPSHKKMFGQLSNHKHGCSDIVLSTGLGLYLPPNCILRYGCSSGTHIIQLVFDQLFMPAAFPIGEVTQGGFVR